MKKYAKFIVALFGAALVIAQDQGLFVDANWFQYLILIATVLGVYHVKNEKNDQ